jgi:O-acetyl-ADP-ribose deacetylase (regulator of RNase III)
MMILKEEKRNLFEVDDKYYLAHCISEDCAMGAGIAVDFNKRFRLQNRVKNIISEHYNTVGEIPKCVLVDKVYNLITKQKYWHKPTYESLTQSLLCMRDMIEFNKTKYLAMPKIGCGLDKLQWSKVREIICDVFKDVDIEILVCYL